jgi:hypothetical protein
VPIRVVGTPNGGVEIAASRRRRHHYRQARLGRPNFSGNCLSMFLFLVAYLSEYTKEYTLIMRFESVVAV